MGNLHFFKLTLPTSSGKVENIGGKVNTTFCVKKAWLSIAQKVLKKSEKYYANRGRGIKNRGAGVTRQWWG
jgi:hypothetical protein